MATESRESFRGSNAANATKITELQELLEKKEAQVSELTQRVADTTEIQQQVLEKEWVCTRIGESRDGGAIGAPPLSHTVYVLASIGALGTNY